MAGSTVGIKEIAAAAGVSIATVSRHLSGKAIRPAYRARVVEALSGLDYRPNLGARRLRSGDAGLIGLVVPDIGNPFFVTLIRAMETMAWQEGLRLVICNSDENPHREAQLLSMLEDERVTGIVIAPAVGSTAPNTAIPTVLVDRGFTGAGHDVIVLDNAGAAASIVEALRADGRCRLLGLFGEWGLTARERRCGFADQCARDGLTMSTMAVPYDAVARRELVREAVRANTPDAIVCGDSLILLDAAIAVGENSLCDVRLAGFDSAEWLRLIPTEPIIVIQPVEEIAHAALALLISRMAGHEFDPMTMTFSGRITVDVPDRIGMDAGQGRPAILRTERR